MYFSLTLNKIIAAHLITLLRHTFRVALYSVVLVWFAVCNKWLSPYSVCTAPSHNNDNNFAEGLQQRRLEIKAYD